MSAIEARWEPINLDGNGSTSRMRIHNGWLVRVAIADEDFKSVGVAVTFVPDAGHEWAVIAHDEQKKANQGPQLSYDFPDFVDEDPPDLEPDYPEEDIDPQVFDLPMPGEWNE